MNGLFIILPLIIIAVIAGEIMTYEALFQRSIETPKIAEKADFAEKTELESLPDLRIEIPPPPPSYVKLDAQFISQAPFFDWSDPKQENGCEEAAAIMAINWARGKKISLKEAEREIIAISDYQLEKYGYFEDTSAADTLQRIIREYFGYGKSSIKYSIGINDIKSELAHGRVVLAPINGRIIANPNYTPPGPFQHMILIIGYDDEGQSFIVNDPGTNYGGSVYYSYEKMAAALQDYESGYHKPISELRTVLISVEKE